MPTDPNSLRVVELRRAGVAFEQIAERLGLGEAATARAMYDQALASDDKRFDPELEAARLERLHTAIWPVAAKGDLAAIDRVVKIGERRERLVGPPKVNAHQLRGAFDESVAASAHVRPVDQALVEAGRTIADRVDEAVAQGEGQELTKALYLVPHLNNILRELLATPASRVAAGITEDKGAKGKLAELRSINGSRTA